MFRNNEHDNIKEYIYTKYVFNVNQINRNNKNIKIFQLSLF